MDGGYLIYVKGHKDNYFAEALVSSLSLYEPIGNNVARTFLVERLIWQYHCMGGQFVEKVDGEYQWVTDLKRIRSFAANHFLSSRRNQSSRNKAIRKRKREADERRRSLRPRHPNPTNATNRLNSAAAAQIGSNNNQTEWPQMHLLGLSKDGDGRYFFHPKATAMRRILSVTKKGKVEFVRCHDLPMDVVYPVLYTSGDDIEIPSGALDRLWKKGLADDPSTFAVSLVSGLQYERELKLKPFDKFMEKYRKRPRRRVGDRKQMSNLMEVLGLLLNYLSVEKGLVSQRSGWSEWSPSSGDTLLFHLTACLIYSAQATDAQSKALIKSLFLPGSMNLSLDNVAELMKEAGGFGLLVDKMSGEVQSGGKCKAYGKKMSYILRYAFASIYLGHVPRDGNEVYSLIGVGPKILFEALAYGSDQRNVGVSADTNVCDFLATVGLLSMTDARNDEESNAYHKKYPASPPGKKADSYKHTSSGSSPWSSERAALDIMSLTDCKSWTDVNCLIVGFIQLYRSEKMIVTDAVAELHLRRSDLDWSTLDLYLERKSR